MTPARARLTPPRMESRVARGGPRGHVLAMALLAAVASAAAAPAPEPATPSVEARAELLRLADERRFDAEAFAPLAANPDARIRAGVADALGELANPAVAPLVVRLAHDGDADVRAAAAAAAGRLIATMPAGARAAGTLGVEIHRLLLDPAPGVRSAAAWAVGAGLRPGSDLWLLQRLGREKDAKVEAAILQELWRFPGTLWIKRATMYVGSGDAAVRLAATRSLSRSGRREAAIGLRRSARDPDPLVRMMALEGATHGHADALWPELLSKTGDPDARVRVAALQGLTAVLRREPSRTLPPADIERLQHTLDDADPDRVQERVAAIRLAGAAKRCQAQLKAAVASGEPWVAGEALAAWAETGESDAEAAVHEWFAAQGLPRRLAAVKAFGGSGHGREPLVAALGDAQAAVRLAAIEALGDDADPQVTDAVRQRLSDRDEVVRAAAIQALAERKKLPPPEDLLRLLAHERNSTTPDAAVALVDALGAGKTLPEGAEAALEGMVSSTYPVRARAAWKVLAAHGIARPLPVVRTGEDAAFYRKVAEWATKPRWIEIVTVRGTLQVVLDTADAPLTCFRLSELAEKKFFDGLTIHRVEPNFVVQGGDPRGDGWGGPGFTLRDELSVGPFENGSVGMALEGPDTGGSQFFVTITPRAHLDGRYPLVGKLAAGLEVAQRLRAGDRIVKARVGEGAVPQYFPVWYGWLDPARIDKEIPGWREEREKYRGDAKWLDLLRTARVRYDLIVAMGTWCSDSREQIPRLQAVLRALGSASPFDPPRLLGIDRSKSVDAKAFPYGPVELVPTIVVAAGGSEVGRIVETPKSPSLEEDLARILAPVEGWQLPDE